MHGRLKPMGYIGLLIKKDGSHELIKADSLQEIRHKRTKLTKANPNETYISTRVVPDWKPLTMQFKAVIKGVKHG